LRPHNAQVDEAFFADVPIKSNFLCNLGYGDMTKLHPRDPRLPFDDVAVIV
jgi:3-hydroxypropanoate dehydrogenase